MNALDQQIMKINDQIRKNKKEAELLEKQLRLATMAKSPYSIQVVQLAELWFNSFGVYDEAWYYESWEKPGPSKRYYAELIKKLLDDFSSKEIELICKIKKEHKYHQ